jgi:hypothetical protein
VVRRDNDPEVPEPRQYLPDSLNSGEEGDAVSDELENEAAMLRATSDGLMLAINEVVARERLKRGVPPADPAFLELAREVRIAAEVALELARKEEETARMTANEPGVGHLPAIESVSPGHELAIILEQWRAVEQRLAAAPVGSTESRDLMIEFQRMRDQYARVVDAKRRRS